MHRGSFTKGPDSRRKAEPEKRFKQGGERDGVIVAVALWQDGLERGRERKARREPAGAA